MKKMKKNFFIAILLFTCFAYSQNIISVPFPDGWIGTVGTNPQKADNVQSFATMGIARMFLTQSSNSGKFEIQGNDVNIVLKIELLDGSVLELPGTLYLARWKR